MNFEESQKYLYSLGNEVLAMKLGLENISILLNELGNPHEKYKKVQIAGTNGKGSTVAFLESICLQAGIEVGVTISPHLISVTERVRINGQDISEKDFAKYATKVRETAERLVVEKHLESVPTYFEQVTAIALLAFAEARIELAILETGLGGRFDATTAAKAEIVAITTVDLDHQQILGNTLGEIAAEKAAIIRKDTKIVIGKQKEEALKIIIEQCRKMKVKPIMNCQWFEENFDEVFYKTENGAYLGNLGLEGIHQRDNACVAISLAEVLAKDFGFKISSLEIENGLSKAKHKGRLEWLEINNTRILFDGAHNIAGAKALKKYLEKCESNIAMIFGAMKDKDLTEIAEILFPFAEDLILTKATNARSMETSKLKKYAEKVIPKSKIFIVSNLKDSIDSAMQINANYPSIKSSFICVTGSLYLVGEIQKYLGENYDLSTNSSINS